jgi:glyceraldehyde-3-phosphate dehydrogenase/erythrose-4-phosphate dehydrogenase
MTIRVAINGYGRIGRNILRAHYEGGKKHDIEIVAINDLGDPKTNAHLTRYDTAHGKFPGTVEVDGDFMVVNGDKIRVLANRNPAELPWGDLKVDVVLECTGFFTTKEKAGARSATMSMIPTKTGAAAAVGLVLPELNGKLDGYAIRVPTINVSIVDLSFIARRDTTVEEVNGILKAASEGELKGILDYNTEPLVSVDYNHNPASSTVDASLTKVSGRLVKVSSWYDNEWGFSNRMLDTTVALMSAK